MAIVNVGDGNIFSVSTPNTETTSALFSQLASLLHVGTREDGRYYLADISQADTAELWARYKSFQAQLTFDNEADREAAREGHFFGINVDKETQNLNSYVKELSFSRAKPLSGYTPPYYNRLRDWHRYHPNAKSAVLIKTHDTASISSTITLETNGKTEYNVGMADLLNYLRDNSSNALTSFQWVVTDPFGFIHEIGGTYTRDSILNYLTNASEAKLTPNITSDYRGKAYNNYQAIPTPNRLSTSWTLGLMGWTTKNDRYILNPVRFPEASVSTCPVRLSGFCPNMTIGTAYMGRTTFKDILYNNGGDNGAITCCSDDYLFMGFTILNLGSSTFDMRKLRVLFINNILNLRPYATNIAMYNVNSFQNFIPVNGTIGSGGGIATAWANGMMYIRMTNLWNISASGFMAIAYVESSAKIQLLTPYIPISFKNMGVTTTNIQGSLKATLPEVKPVDNTWSQTIQ